MDLREAMIERRSVRRFKDIRPSDDLLLEILDVARWAPSHCNTQNVFFLVISDDDVKQKIVDMGGSVIIKNAPIGVLVLYDNHSDNKEYLDYIQSGSAIVQNFLLYSYAKGLATCWVAHLPTKQDLRDLLDIPATYDPIAYILVGYPEKPHKTVPRKYNIKDIVAYNAFPGRNVTKTSSIHIDVKRCLRMVYYKLPTSVKRLLNPIVDRLFVKKFEN